MGLMTSTISASGFAAWMQCDDCKAGDKSCGEDKNSKLFHKSLR